jgi:predicted nucleotidyltransferase component of viral defense system
MKKFLQLSTEDRKTTIEDLAREISLEAVIVEKDFWVCWTLHQLFSLPDIAPHILFKGGTTLSKVYNIIERFSEDVDVSVSRDFLGFGGDNEPEKAVSNTQKRKRIDDLKEVFAQTVKEKVFPALHQKIATELEEMDWSLTISPIDAGTLEFVYPTCLSESLAYIRPAVKIEMGGRSDVQPFENRTMTSYLAERYPQFFDTTQIAVRVLSIERTFWEKATILHDEFYRPEERLQGERASRHYYDLVMLHRSTEVVQKAFNDMSLLARVVEHKNFFYKNKWSRYDKAVRGSFHLLPPDYRLPSLRSDYQAMRPMFLGDSMIPFEDIIQKLKTLEDKINSGI